MDSSRIVSKHWRVASSRICTFTCPNNWVRPTHSHRWTDEIFSDAFSLHVRSEGWLSILLWSRLEDPKRKSVCSRGFSPFPPCQASLLSLRNDRSLPMSLEFIRVRSYVNDRSSDQLEIIGLSDLTLLKNKHLLIIEDIIDTGVTMVALKKELEKFNPKTIHVVSLFTKRRSDKKCIFKPDYSGFEVPDQFIVGYALVRTTPCRLLSRTAELFLLGL